MPWGIGEKKTEYTALILYGVKTEDVVFERRVNLMN